MTLHRTVQLLLISLATGCAELPPPQTGAASSAPTLELEIVPSPLLAAPLFSLRGEPYQLLFHLNLRNAGDRPLTLERLELRLEQAGQLLGRRVLERPQLARQLRQAPWILVRDRQSLAAAHRQRGLLQRAAGRTRLEPGAVVSWAGRLLFEHSGEVPSYLGLEVSHGESRSSCGAEVQLYQQQTPLRLPVAGAGWWVLAGHQADEYHGAAVLLSQSFAYDLGQLGAGGVSFSGDPLQNTAYLAHGQPVVAAADGTVVDLHDGLADNTPVGQRPSWPELLLRPADLAGNYVVLEHRGGEHTAYLHLRPGLAVQRGQRLHAGQLLGTCGNSGNSLESHLHFQLQDGPEIMRANGLPARFSDFTVLDGGRAYYVPAEQPRPLPSRLGVSPGRAPWSFPLPPPLVEPSPPDR